MKVTRSYTIEQDVLTKLEEIAKTDYMGNNSMAVNNLLERGIRLWLEEKIWLDKRNASMKNRNTI